MAKLKPKWVKTDTPKDTKIKLWRIMVTNYTYDSCMGYASKHFDEIFSEDEQSKVFLISRDTYKRLQDEIRQMPKEEVETLPCDLQAWVQQLRPELVKSRETIKSAPTAVDDVVAKSLWRHWTKLAKVAEELVTCLGFYRLYTPQTFEGIHIDYSGLGPGYCFFDGSRVWFSAEGDPLYGCLVQHLSTDIPEFSEKLEQVRGLAAKSLTESEESEPARLHWVRDDKLVSDLRHTLWLVAEQATFKGKCDVCKDW